MAQSDQAGVAEPIRETLRRRKLRDDRRPKRQPRYSVILWNDEDHSYAYVIAMLMQLFGHPTEKGFQIAQAVDTEGRAAVLTTTKEHAEHKRDQIHAFGKDDEIDNCMGSMWATIEPVPGE
jgi:ATP-dependent Clp protease adaptor protein ClpS